MLTSLAQEENLLKYLLGCIISLHLIFFVFLLLFLVQSLILWIFYTKSLEYVARISKFLLTSITSRHSLFISSSLFRSHFSFLYLFQSVHGMLDVTNYFSKDTTLFCLLPFSFSGNFTSEYKTCFSVSSCLWYCSHEPLDWLISFLFSFRDLILIFTSVFTSFNKMLCVLYSQ